MTMNNFQFPISNFQKKRGYTLIELTVAVGLFALIMTLVAGAYLMMISITQKAQGISSGIDNLSFALETMTRSIRTGTDYFSTGSTFSFTNASGFPVSYGLNGSTLSQSVNGKSSDLTDPSVQITTLTFSLSGASKADNQQPYVSINIDGSVTTGAGKSENFSVRTSAVMRTIDI